MVSRLEDYMIKKLVIAAAFAASLTVGVQPASASAFLCNQQYEEATLACGENQTCQIAAEIQLVECLQALVPVKDPIDD